MKSTVAVSDFARPLAGWLCLTAFAVAAVAQTSDYAQWPIELGTRGFISGAPFDLSSFDPIDAVNDNVILSVPLASLPAGHAGSGFNLTLTYNSAMYDVQTEYLRDSPTAITAHEDDQMVLANPYKSISGTPWLYSYKYGLYTETRSGQPVLVQNGPQYSLEYCSYQYDQVAKTWSVDSGNSSYAEIYAARSYALFPDGSSHPLVLLHPTAPKQTALSGSDGWSTVAWNGQIMGCGTWMNSVPAPSFPLQFITEDGTFVRVTVDQNYNWTMYFPDGRRALGTTNAFGGALANELVDRNGNTVTISNLMSPYPKNNPPCYTPQDSSDPVTIIKDSFGRCIQIETPTPGPDPNQPYTDVITQAGSSAADGSATNLVTKVNWSFAGINFVYQFNVNGGYQFGYEDDCASSNTCSANDPPPCSLDGTCDAKTFTAFVTSIDLNQAGFYPSGTPLSYSFKYGITANSYGHPVCGGCELTDVTLPEGANAGWSGAKIHYDFANTPFVFNGMPITDLAGKTLTHTDPYTGQTYTDSWTYCPWLGGGSACNNVPNPTIINPDGSKTIYHVYPVGSGEFTGHAFEIDKQDSGSHLLSRLEQMWVGNTDPYGANTANLYVKADFRSVAPQGSSTPSLSAIRVYSEDANGNIGEIDESGWVNYSTVSGLTRDSYGGINQVPSLSALRSTINSYYTSATTSPYWNDWTSDGSGCSPCILNTKTSTETLDSGNPLAYSECKRLMNRRARGAFGGCWPGRSGLSSRFARLPIVRKKFG